MNVIKLVGFRGYQLKILLSMMFLPFCSVAAEGLGTIIIDAGYDRRTSIAIVPFDVDRSLGPTDRLADIIGFDLARSGYFDPMAFDNMLSLPTKPEEVFFRDWRILGVEYLVIGRGLGSLPGNGPVEYRVYDVYNEREISSGIHSVNDKDWRAVAHLISDEVFELITGIRGAFSTQLAYVLATNVGLPTATYNLEIADSDGQRGRTLFSSSQPLMSASWSPDGKLIAYVSFEERRPSIIVQEIATGNRRKIAQFQGLNGSPVFSPDGEKMAMVLSRDGNPEIYVMRLSDGRLRRITRHHGIDTEPSWDASGDRIIFTSDRGGQPQIYQVDLNTNYVERLTFRGSYNARARLLGDGNNMVYVHRRDGLFHIARQSMERDDFEILTSTNLDESPSIAPNGTMLIYATQDRGRGILSVVSIDGRVKYRLPSVSGDVREPAWSPYLENP